MQPSLRDELHSRPAAIRLEGPCPINRVRPLDDVYVEAVRPVELGELDDLLELFANRRLRLLAKSCAEPRGAVGQLFHVGLRRLPLGEVQGIRDIVEDCLRRSADLERLRDAHAADSTVAHWTKVTRAGVEPEPRPGT